MFIYYYHNFYPKLYILSIVVATTSHKTNRDISNKSQKQISLWRS